MNKDSRSGDDGLSQVGKAFPMVRQAINNKKGAMSSLGGNNSPPQIKLSGQSPIKPKKKKASVIDDEELSELSKQYR